MEVISISLVQLGIGVTSVILSIIVFSWTVNKSRNKQIKELFDRKADQSYVDNEIKQLRNVDISSIHKRINEKADDKIVKEILARFEIMDARIYDLWKTNSKYK